SATGARRVSGSRSSLVWAQWARCRWRWAMLARMWSGMVLILQETMRTYLKGAGLPKCHHCPVLLKYDRSPKSFHGEILRAATIATLSDLRPSVRHLPR